MLEPDFYSHPAGPQIRLIQTHISWVLLTGAYAYKVKKPAVLSFLDFGTLDRRRQFCEEELRLNQRGAPGLYLDVVAITESAGGPVLGGTGRPVEYALRMKQFPAEALLSERLARGEVDDAEIEEVARVVADYHAGARRDGQTAVAGMPQRVRATVDANYSETEQFIGGPQTRDQFDKTRAFTDRFFADHTPLLEARAAGGFVRECHGDLHLSNICRWDGRVMLFDCVEFAEAFRFVDVMYDVAFVAMDFDARGRTDLSTLFVNAYAERTGDWAGLRVLPLYLCRQAYVRAKVQSLLLNELSAPQARTEAANSAARYYRLASHYAERGPGRLMLMCGLSGAGKSTIARQIACRAGAIHIRSDAVRKHLVGVTPNQPAPAEAYEPRVSARVYARLLEWEIQLAREGWSVILDARFDRAAMRHDAIQSAAAAGIPISILHCVAPPEVLRARLSSRKNDISDATASLLDRQIEQFEDFTDAERPFVQTLDTTLPSDTLVESVVGPAFGNTPAAGR